MTNARSLVWRCSGLLLCAAGVLTGTAFAFVSLSPGTNLQSAPRWNAAAGVGGSRVHLRVAIEETVAEKLTFAVTGATAPADVAAAEASIRAAFAAWASPVLDFEVTVGGAVEGEAAGADIDVFAVPNTHPIFAGTSFFGYTVTNTLFAADRRLTNGAMLAGFVIDGADIYLNVDRIALIAPIFTAAEGPRALQRLTIHEAGHAIGLHHPNEFPGANYDTDANPLNRMAIDPFAPFDDLQASSAVDPNSIMSNLPAIIPGALLYTTLRFDERGGRDVLYPSPIPAPGCDPVPRTDCRASTRPAKSTLQIVHGDEPDDDVIRFVWSKGAATDASAFGDPLTVDAVTLCVYDRSATGVVYRGDAPAGGRCTTKDCWKPKGSPAGAKGWVYVDEATTPHGVSKVTLTPGEAGKARVAVEAKGSLVETSPVGFPTMPLALPVEVQVQVTNGECWAATFGSARRNDAGRFRAKSD
ncbi:MAG TPA: hypothetical protein VGR62_15120 [Candidatus Binatia bacterium]|jgi:hypothetical protein|nr:hypothetical protein [Candidatus Binatia bacterium]